MKDLFQEGWHFLCMPLGSSYQDAKNKVGEFCEVDLPHDWLIYDSTRLYEDGTGWYRKAFYWDKQEKKRAFLQFDGVYMDSAIYVNGKLAGEWKYGYSSFSVEMTDFLEKGENEIMVSATFRHPNSRWYSGAGIYREVTLRITEEVCIEENGVYVSSKKKGEDYVLEVETCLDGVWDERNVGGTDTTEKLIEEAAYRVVHQLFRYKAGETIGEPLTLVSMQKRWEAEPFETPEKKVDVQNFLVEKPLEWDVEAPNLYCLRTSLYRKDSLLDTEDNVIGFRTTVFDCEKGFFLNGRSLKLNGVCEHHDLGALGAAFHKEAMRRKLRILKKMGVNAIRGAHNMFAKGVLELADEMGFLLLSEAFDMWERPKNPYDYARFFKEWSGKDVKSWICRDRNHPSVIMWSIGNEIYDTHADEHGQEITRYLMELVRKYDSRENAPVTVGSNYMPWENAQNCADIYKLAGYNYAEKYYEEHHRKHPDWMIYGSETSSIVQSRGVYHFPLKAGILAEDDEQCSALGNSSTSWGARSMEDCVTKDRDTEFSLGQFLWSGFDYIGEPTPYHTKNSYFGQIDTAGFPKDSYYVWQSAWTDYRKAPMVHIFPYWDFNEGQLIDVRVCSNAPWVELFLNGNSLGRKHLTHKPGSGKDILADYQVAYEKGTLLAVAYDEEMKEIARQERNSFGNSARIILLPETTELYIETEDGQQINRQKSLEKKLRADGADMLFVEIGTVDAEGNRVENACDRVRVEVTGAGRLVGLDNGDSTDYDSYKGKTRRLFNGKLLAMIQTKKEAGNIRIKVTGAGLEEAVLCCESIPAKNREGICAKEENTERPVVTGREKEIPVRKIVLQAPTDRIFTLEQKEMTVEAFVEPAQAEDKELVFKAVNDMGVDSNLVKLVRDGNKVKLTALGDGEFRLRCMSKSGTDKIRLISQLEFRIEGLGQAYLNPYDFISGSQYTYVKGEAGNGNERGVATARDGETIVAYENIDFGSVGSDEITVPIFALSSEEYPIQIWEGLPGEGELLADVIYQKPSIWNVYQPETWKINKRLTGISSISFLLRQKVHIKGFSFTKLEKAWLLNRASEADAVYGDSFVKTEETVEKIGNNVSLEFKGMDFGNDGAGKLRIRGRAPESGNTIHVRFLRGEEEIKQIVEFPESTEWEEHCFSLEPQTGKWDVIFVFLPGSCFDFEWFRFEP